MPEAPVGNTSRNREDLNVLNAVETGRIVKEHTGALLEQTFFGQQGDGFFDKSR